MTTEERLERMAARLGEEAADRVDPERVAATVLARLRVEGRRVPWWQRVQVTPALAAAAVLAIAVGLGTADRTRSGDEGWFDAPLPVVMADLAETELNELLDSLAYETPVSELVPAGIHELSVRELEALLEVMEG